MKGATGFKITRIDLATEGEVPNISAEQFAEIAEGAKVGCPVSQLVTGAEIFLTATLKK